MIEKWTTFSIDKDDIRVYDPNSMDKTAALVLPEDVIYDPDFLYVLMKGVSSGEIWGPNKNSDWFPAAELEQTYLTFLNGHVFKNHENKDVKNAIGDVLKAEWIVPMQYVQLLVRIDNKIAPSIIRGLQKGYMTDVSMGCRVKHSICSICGNVAKTQREYCDHVKNERGRIYDDGQRVYEINIGPNFHDISVVLTGAEKSAKVMAVHMPGGKVAEKTDTLLQKVAGISEDLRVVGEPTVSSSPDPLQNPQRNDLLIASGQVKLALAAGQKIAAQKKVADIDKTIDSQITDISQCWTDDAVVESVDAARDVLKMCCEEYWDEAKCTEIASLLSQLSEERLITKEEIFKQFLNTLTFTGCELAPKEFRLIFEHLFGLPSSEESETMPYTDALENQMFDINDSMGRMNFSQALPAATIIIRKRVPAPLAIQSSGLSSPLRGLGMLLSQPRMKSVSESSPSLLEKMRRMLHNDIDERSYFSPTIIKRASADAKQNETFFLMKTANIADDVCNALYCLYQQDRCNLFGSAEQIKMAESIVDPRLEKTAIKYNAATAWTLGLPLTFGYSALQRSRIQNGQNVSSLNRAIAENPSNAYVVQALIGPKALKSGKRTLKDLKVKGKDAINTLERVSNKIKVASETPLVDYVLEKKASQDDIPSRASVDDAAFGVYNGNKLVAKTALCCMGEEKIASSILSGYRMTERDLDVYIGHEAFERMQHSISQMQKEASLLCSTNLSKVPDTIDPLKLAVFALRGRDKNHNE